MGFEVNLQDHVSFDSCQFSFVVSVCRQNLRSWSVDCVSGAERSLIASLTKKILYYTFDLIGCFNWDHQ